MKDTKEKKKIFSINPMIPLKSKEDIVLSTIKTTMIWAIKNKNICFSIFIMF